MTPRFSVYLDALRFIAAIIVVLSHFAYPRFTDGTYIWIRDLNLGSDAVIIFFVLSGFLIAYTADKKDTTWQSYVFSRATRLYSVVVPAILLTITLDYFGSRIAPSVYDGWWFNDISPLSQIFYALTFSNEWLGQGVRLGTNGPYWSLSYEAAYYILFGVFTFMSGHKKWLVLLPLGIAFGPAVLLLLPSWLAGVYLYKKVLLKTYNRTVSWTLALLPVAVYAACLTINIPHTLLVITHAIFGTEQINETFRFSNEFVWNTLLSLLVAAHLTGVSSLCQNSSKDDQKTTFARLITLLAGASFTLYVVHYPALQFFDSVLPETLPKHLQDFALLSATLILCFAFAEASERRLKWLRKKIKR